MTKETKWYTFRWQTGLVLILACILLWYVMKGRFIHPAGAGPAGPKVAAEPFRHPWSNSDTVLLGIGDSITSGYGATDKHSYIDLLVHNDDSACPDMKGCDLSHVFPNLQFKNNSEPYTTSEEHLREQVKYVSKHTVGTKGIVVMTSGGNDVIHSYGMHPPEEGAMYGCSASDAMKWKEVYHKRLKTMIEKITKQFPGGCEIFIGNIFDPTDDIGDIQNGHPMLMLHPWKDGLKVLDIWNSTIAQTCKEYPNVHLVDLYTPFLGHGIHCTDRRNPHYRSEDPHYWYFENLEDPNDRGYDAIRRIFLQEMVKVLNKKAEH